MRRCTLKQNIEKYEENTKDNIFMWLARACDNMWNEQKKPNELRLFLTKIVFEH